MLDEKELTQVREYVIKILPELLRSEPEIATTIEGILAQHFPRRDEFARLLDELTEFRRETGERFDELTEFRRETGERFDEITEFRRETGQRFDELTEFRRETGQRFEQVDQRFEQVDRRFEQVDRRFEQVDQRFEQVDQRFDQVDQRFEQVDRRLDRLESGQLGLRRDVAKLQSGQESIIRRLVGMEAWMKLVTGQIRNEKGDALEEVVALGLRYGLGQPDIKAEHIRLRQKLVDSDGLVYPIYYETEIDLVANNGDLLVFEVKSSGKFREVSEFAVKLKLLSAQNPDKRVRGVFIAPEPSEEVRRLCRQYEIELVENSPPAEYPS